jgi:hypothetical protein
MDIKDAMIEVPFSEENLLHLIGKNNVAIRNLTFTHSSPALSVGSAVKISLCRNVLVENCHMDWNIGTGIDIGSGDTITYRNCTMNHNGYGGMAGRGWRIRVEDCSASFNRGGFKGGGGGLKFGGLFDAIFTRTVAIGNYEGVGMWLDVFCERVVFENCFSYGSRRSGIMLELSGPHEGDYIVRNCVIANNGHFGALIANSANTRVIGSVIVGNCKDRETEKSGQIGIGCAIRAPWWANADSNGKPGTDGWGYLEIRNNIIADRGKSLLVSCRGEHNENPLMLLNSSGNQYFQSNTENAFGKKDRQDTNLNGWRQMLESFNAPGKRDADSIWKDPGLRASPEEDFTPGSPIFELAKKTGTPIPSDLIEECNSNKWGQK